MATDLAPPRALPSPPSCQDGRLDRAELAAAMREDPAELTSWLGRLGDAFDPGKSVFSFLDSNSDGVVTCEEFSAAFSAAAR